MATQTTQGIRVTVEPTYQPAYSNPLQSRFIFAYQVIIENLGTATVQLLRRHWFIWDADGSMQEVEGEGVIGQQPILPPNGRHEYASWCDLTTGIGKMNGTYLMVDVEKNEQFYAKIPAFVLIAPLRLN
ncbi:Co2+/Mg2+ efflux protein ApaG [Phaeodactylibacter luteus]|uniref:Co2+/Mg2+ efflux protein ApaG n=1 Tax=Phaeodactylibacter luteus TaxID=1564516 RepID=A0A5C6RV85_9BACT|nr:Co2+/Mg2+ efflux protein ApaG [Phaeodactylibacter luteus]TXB66261.1 Co2+/Mg2+ efflux protein ApaG [Phaeodactylibacter luteus]